MHRINFIALRELHRSLPAAQKLIAMLAEQDPPGEWVTVDELEALDGVGRRNAVDLLKALGEHGVGEFRVGRKGHPSRLVWTVDPRQLVLQLRGEATSDEGDDDDASELLDADDEHAELDEDEDEGEDEDDEPRPQLALALQQELDRRMSKLVPAPAPANGRTHARTAGERARPEPHAEPARVEPAKPVDDLIEHVFVLRPNHTVRLALPANLSAREAAVLGDWVRNLSFERG
jgi:hypothetical protein